ncbi:MAG: hypothetical protein HPY66_1831 [Firmicutes bacterium]|nr:hypothetical protein [Bacillota bacterium]
MTVYVRENNPKFFNAIVKRLETYYKSRDIDYSQTDIYKAAWAQMPKQAESNSQAKLQYVNGHFTYALKDAIMCNGSGIIRHMEFCDSFVADNTGSLDPEEAKYNDCEIKGKNRTPRLKYMCPKCRRISKVYVCSCEHPCTDCKCGYIHYEKPSDDIRSHPIIPRDSEQWEKISGSRHIVEQVISSLKLPLRMGGSYIRDTKTAKADFFMSGIAHLVIVYVAYGQCQMC